MGSAAKASFNAEAFKTKNCFTALIPSMKMRHLMSLVIEPVHVNDDPKKLANPWHGTLFS
jgi:hypothetical protein